MFLSGEGTPPPKKTVSVLGPKISVTGPAGKALFTRGTKSLNTMHSPLWQMGRVT